MKVIGIEEIKKLNNDGNVYVIFPGYERMLKKI